MEPDNKALLVMGPEQPIATFFDAYVFAESGCLHVYDRSNPNEPIMVIAAGHWKYARACTRLDAETKAPAK